MANICSYIFLLDSKFVKTFLCFDILSKLKSGLQFEKKYNCVSEDTTFSCQFQIWFQLYKLFKLKELLVMIYEYPFLDINEANPMMLSIPKYR